MTSFNKLWDIGEESKDARICIIAYHNLGIHYLNMKEYEKALICFKLMLKFSLIENNKDEEIASY